MTEQEEKNIKYLEDRIRRLEKDEVYRNAELVSLEPLGGEYVNEQRFLNNHPLDFMSINDSVVLLLNLYRHKVEKLVKKTPLKLPTNEELNRLFGHDPDNYGATKTFDDGYARGRVKGAQYIININK